MKSSEPSKVIFLFGPTAVGKTALLFNVFAHGFEVINADSVQVYRGLDIGSAKATIAEREAVPHHLIDIRDPWEDFSVGDFVTLADEAVSQITGRGNIPVVCGGTAYYFRHFLYGLSGGPKADPVIRQKVFDLLEKNGRQWCYEELSRLDPSSALRIHPNDVYRITRALEVCYTSGGRLSDYPVPTTPREGLDVLILGLTRPKDELDCRIRERVDMMFEQGLVAEIESLISRGAGLQWPSMKAIGYSEYLKAREAGEVDLDSVRQQIIMDSIHYAKRQRVFFNSFPSVHWVNPQTDAGEIASLVSSFTRSKNDLDL